MSRLDGVNISDIRSMASQDDDSHHSITSRVARAFASSTNSRSRSTSKSTLVGHSDHGVGVRMLGTLNVPSRHGKAAAAQDHIVSISNDEARVCHDLPNNSHRSETLVYAKASRRSYRTMDFGTS